MQLVISTDLGSWELIRAMRTGAGGRAGWEAASARDDE